MSHGESTIRISGGFGSWMRSYRTLNNAREWLESLAERYRPMRWIRHAGLTLILILVADSYRVSAGSGPLAIAWNDPLHSQGWVRLYDSIEPWGARSEPLPVGRDAILRYVNGTLFAVSRTDSLITAIQTDDWTVSHTYELDRNSFPIDIGVINERSAWVAREKATHLLHIDLTTGAMREAVDLSPWADADGIPDLGTMTLHDGKLYVQIRRLNPDFLAVPPAYLAVVDPVAEQLVDTDPAEAGVQAIALSGTPPKMKMQVIPGTDQLFVSATGGSHDSGGIERIDLRRMRSDGLVIREADGLTGADLGPFVMVTPDRGFLSFTTDLDLSSHLHAFTLERGTSLELLHNVILGYFAPALEWNPESNVFFFPVSRAEFGVHAFDATTGHRLSARPLPTEGPPTDLVLIPEPRGAIMLVSLIGVLLCGRRILLTDR